MFEFIRTHKRWMQILLALLIIPSFVVVGVSSYGNSSGGTEVASVGGTKITQPEWEEAQRRQMDRYRAMMGARFDQKMLETPDAKQAILENLVAERAVDVEIFKNHLTVSDAVLQKTIASQNDFKGPDGKFDMEQYKALLANQGMSPAIYDARLRRDMALQQLNGAIQSTAFVPRSVTARLFDITEQEREVQEQLFPADAFTAQVKVSDDMVKAYYDKNAALFQIAEQVKAEYVVFDAAAVESLVTVPDAEVAAFYKANEKRFTAPEQRQYAHILVTAAKDASAATKAAAKAKADAILAEVRKAPAEFAQIAKTKSEDVASAEKGGDLGLAEKGMFASGAIEDAVYKLKQGEISDVVASDFGYHIVTVTRLQPSAIKPLDEVKDQIAAELKAGKMSKKYSELAQQFNETVYDQAESLKPVADKLKLKIETIANIGRNPNPALGKAPFNDAKFLKALFADETLKNKRNTEAVEVAPSTLIAGRVVEFKPAAKRPLAEVDAAIRARVTQEEAAKLARKAGETRLAAAKAAGDATGFGEAKVLSRAKPTGINPTAAQAVMKADVSKLPAYVGVDVPGIGYGIYRIGKVAQPATPNEAGRAAAQEGLNNAVAQMEMYGYIEALKAKAKAKILVKPVEVAVGEVKVAPAVK